MMDAAKSYSADFCDACRVQAGGIQGVSGLGGCGGLRRGLAAPVLCASPTVATACASARGAVVALTVTTFNVATLSVTALSMTAFSVTAFSVTAFSVAALPVAGRYFSLAPSRATSTSCSPASLAAARTSAGSSERERGNLGFRHVGEADLQCSTAAYYIRGEIICIQAGGMDVELLGQRLIGTAIGLNVVSVRWLVR
jgi:hypothetical protein